MKEKYKPNAFKKWKEIDVDIYLKYAARVLCKYNFNFQQS